MAFFSGLAAAASALITGVSAFNQYKQSKDATRRANAAMAEQMLAQQRAVQIQQEQERIRQKQMQAEAARQQRANIRQAQVARAMAVNRAGSSGSLFGSGVSGVIGSISGQAGVQSTSIYSNTAAANQMFDLNNQLTQSNLLAAQNISSYNQRAASAQSSAAMWSGVGNLAGSVLNNAGTASNVFQSLFGTTSGWEATVTRA